MKLGRGFKLLLLWTCGVLYATGLAAWLLASRFQVDRGYGPEPSPMRPFFLHSHSIAGLLFLVLFGYLWKDHVEPGLRKFKKRRSGLTLLAALVSVLATVPPLFYATGQTARAWTVAIHVWLGAALLAPFLFHSRSARV